MWVLSTDRAELHFFPSPETIPGGYAALSHVWDGEEQSFKEVRKIQKRCARDGTNPRDLVSEKIRRCCELAEKHGYRWVWIDTCCIDKTSSAELSEAINSMFRYYALAAVCYGYLRDVRSVFLPQESLEKERIKKGRIEEERNLLDLYSYRQLEEVRRSIWFRRGWTLQELIAPRFFVFVSSPWQVIGTKADLASFLERHFHIPAAVLRLQVSHTEFSVAQRMSWFQSRETTRPEDEAYCLLGLFNIHMPPLYGEGRNAFRRLQEEIMKQSADTTLFAWTGEYRKLANHSLLAVSPADFAVEKPIIYTPPQRPQMPALDIPHESEDSEHETRHGDVHDMTFAVTPTGIRACIPIFTWRGETFGDLYWSSGEGRRVFLHLEHNPDIQSSSARCPSFRVAADRLTWTYEYADVRPPDGLPLMKDVLIRHRPPLRSAPGQLPDSTTSTLPPAIPMQLTFDAPVRFPDDRIRQFLVDSRSDDFHIGGAGLRSPWGADRSLPTVYAFWRRKNYDGFVIMIVIGRCDCQQQEPAGEQRGLFAIWATVCTTESADSSAELEEKIRQVSVNPQHECSRDHIEQWPDLRKTFTLDNTLSQGEVTLSFTPCPLNPGRTLILDASFINVTRNERSWTGLMIDVD